MFLSFCLGTSFSFWNMVMSVQTEVHITYLLVLFECFFSVFISLLELRFADHPYNFSSFILGKRSLPLITQLLIHRVHFASCYSLMIKVLKLD